MHPVWLETTSNPTGKLQQHFTSILANMIRQLTRNFRPLSGYRSSWLSYPMMYAVAVLLMAIYFWILPMGIYAGDAVSYLQAATKLESGVPDYARTPVYPALIVLCRRLADLFGQPILTRCFIILSNCCLYLIGIHFFRRIALLVLGRQHLRLVFWLTALMCLEPGIVGSTNMVIMTESMAVCFTLIYIWFALSNYHNPSIRRTALMLLWFIILVFTRPASLYMIGITVVYLLFFVAKYKRGSVRYVVTACIGFCILGGAMSAYMSLYEKAHGFRKFSYVSVWNSYFLLRRYGLIQAETCADPVMADIIKRKRFPQNEFLEGSPAVWVEMDHIVRESGHKKLGEYVDSMRNAHPMIFVKAGYNNAFMRFGTQPIFEPFSMEIYDKGILKVRHYLRLFPFDIAFELMLFFGLLVYFIVWYRRRRVFNFDAVFLWLLIVGLMALVAVGSYGDFTRLLIPVLGPSVLLLAWWCTRLRLNMSGFTSQAVRPDNRRYRYIAYILAAVFALYLIVGNGRADVAGRLWLDTFHNMMTNGVPDYNQMPLYPLVAGGLMVLLGYNTGYWTVIGLQMALYFAMIPMIRGICRRVMPNEKWSFWTTAVIVLLPGCNQYAYVVQPVLMCMVLCSAVGWLLVQPKLSMRYCMMLVGCLTALCLLKYEFVFAIAPMLVYFLILLLKSKGGPRRVACTGMAGLLLLCLALSVYASVIGNTYGTRIINREALTSKWVHANLSGMLTAREFPDSSQRLFMLDNMLSTASSDIEYRQRIDSLAKCIPDSTLYKYVTYTLRKHYLNTAESYIYNLGVRHRCINTLEAFPDRVVRSHDSMTTTPVPLHFTLTTLLYLLIAVGILLVVQWRRCNRLPSAALSLWWWVTGCILAMYAGMCFPMRIMYLWPVIGIVVVRACSAFRFVSPVASDRLTATESIMDPDHSVNPDRL